MATDSMAISHGAETRTFSQGAVVVLGRFLFVLIFLMVVPHHFAKQTIAFAASQGWRLAPGAVPGSGHLDDAQVLGSAGSDDGADPNDSVHE